MTSELGLTIQSTLEAYQLPGGSTRYFAKVFKGEPGALTVTGGKPLARWRVLRSQVPPEGPRVVNGHRMTSVVYGVTAYWPLSAVEGAQQSQEDDIATVLIDLPNRFIALTATEYTIGGYPVALLTVEDTSGVERSVPFPSAGVDQAEMRITTWELHARVLEAS